MAETMTQAAGKKRDVVTLEVFSLALRYIAIKFLLVVRCDYITLNMKQDGTGNDGRIARHISVRATCLAFWM